MLNIAICDDSTQDLSHITSLLNNYIAREKNNHDLKYSTFHNAIDLIELMEKGEIYDLVILDIIMPMITGMDAARDIRTFNHDVKIIFITSSCEFAVESYSVGAYYYAIKPIQTEELFSLLNKVFLEIEVLEQKSFLVKSKTALTRIAIHRLEYAEVNLRTIRYHIKDGSVIEADGSMTKLEKLLNSESCFVKPHRSYLVNMNFIDKLFQREIQLCSGSTVPMSKANYQTIKNTYMKFIF